MTEAKAECAVLVAKDLLYILERAAEAHDTSVELIVNALLRDYLEKTFLAGVLEASKSG